MKVTFITHWGRIAACVGIGAQSNLDQLLDHKINRRVKLALGADSRVVTIRPSNTNTAKGLRYRRWVEDNRAYVDRISNGRLGYVHMVNMSVDALNQLYLDLDAENHSREGVVIDIRENSGGFLNAYAIDVFSRRGYLTLAPRGQPATPARSILGNVRWSLPPYSSRISSRSPMPKTSLKATAHSNWARLWASQRQAGSSTRATGD